MTKFSFIGVHDGGENAHCPHCGAEGRWIYVWSEDGVVMGAMAGCYKALTGHLTKSDKDKYFILLSEKQAKNKPLNSWDRSILRLLDYKHTGKYPDNWLDKKIDEVLRQRARYLRERHY